MLGRLLFRWRGAIGLVAFGILLWLGRPTPRLLLLGLGPILAGLAIRFWAAGYIGRAGRASEVGADRLVRAGPYRLFPHPLYLGNLLLVLGMLVGLRAPIWASLPLLVGFAVEYSLIAAAERHYIAVHSPPVADDAFGGERAATEWPTWLVTGIAWLLGLAKALLAAR